MPLLNNERIPLAEPIPYDPKRRRKEVWYLRCTNEIFTSYEAYINRMSLYQQPIWKCEHTGRPNLTYEQALESEYSNGTQTDELFCSELRKRMLMRIQYRTVNLDTLVEDLYTHFLSNFEKGEIVHCLRCEDVYLARVVDVIPHSDMQGSVTEEIQTPGQEKSADEVIPRQPNGRLRFPDAFLHPIPKGEETSSSTSHTRSIINHQSWIRYRIQIIDDHGQPLEDHLRIVDASEISRDKQVFCRQSLRQFVSEYAYQDDYAGAQWLIKPDPLVISNAHPLGQSLPTDWQDDNGRKRKYVSDTREAEKRARKEEVMIHKAMLKEQKERIRMERRKQAAIKYPIEDLDLPIYRKDPNHNWTIVDIPNDSQTEIVIPFPNGGKPARPLPYYSVGIPHHLFERFLVVWNFLTVFARHLKISPCSVDDFEQALLSSSRVLVESHICLLNIIIEEHQEDEQDTGYEPRQQRRRRRSSTRDNDEDEEQSDRDQVKDEDESNEFGWHGDEQLRLCEQWDDRIIRSDRKGWDIALIGCLNHVITPKVLPSVQRILIHLVPRIKSTIAERERQYHSLSIEDKIDILYSLIDLVNDSDVIKDCMDECQEQLADIKRQRLELNREYKLLATKRLELDRREQEYREKDREKDETQSNEESNGEEDDSDGSVDSGSDDDNDDSSGSADNSDGEDNPEKRPRRSLTRQEKLKKLQQKRTEQEQLRRKQYAKQREESKARNQELRQRAEERRKLDDDEKILHKKEEQLEKDMQKHMLLRIRPLGRDRFYNRYIYLDNVGASTSCGAGRLYVQSPSDVDILMMLERERAEVESSDTYPWKHGGGRRFIFELMKHHGFEDEIKWLEDRMFKLAENPEATKSDVGWWKYYSEPEEIENLLAWLNPKGVRENKLKNELEKHQKHIVESMKKRAEEQSKAESKSESLPKRSTRS